ncbi:hypothetical protein Bealeia1_01731 [Candidatus Bealeia paramacronuclearis]|uniref:Uncharacterized protein n=1 Tax=Candidatus Bealeia paramacronuclearis TaxID=1921001 RepID=A0ABZ2C654_9PROT|nr:hypothetical protein [Candidatus Bealeia paramacronuclearis]
MLKKIIMLFLAIGTYQTLDSRFLTADCGGMTTCSDTCQNTDGCECFWGGCRSVGDALKMQRSEEMKYHMRWLQEKLCEANPTSCQ